MKILIVEVDTNRQRQLRTILTSIGYKSAEMETVTDMKSGLNTLRKKRFDCAFVSLGNPKLDGIAFLKEIKGGAATKGIPVVMYSSEVTKENVLASHEAGATTFLSYPFSVSDVESVLKSTNK